jgi:hypothetical protein
MLCSSPLALKTLAERLEGTTEHPACVRTTGDRGGALGVFQMTMLPTGGSTSRRWASVRCQRLKAMRGVMETGS